MEPDTVKPDTKETVPQPQADMLARIETAIEEACGLLDHLSPAQATWKPAPDKWSVVECIEHLNQSMRTYLPALSNTIEAGGPRGTGPFTYGLRGRTWMWFLRPGGFKLPAPGRMLPRRRRTASGEKVAHDPAVVSLEFRTINEDFAGLVRASVGLDLGAVKLQSPLFKWLTLPLGAWFESNLIHHARHIAQAKRVTEIDGFPRN